ncbi:MAG TPA: hypothetical protein GX729_05260 [Firmicutes bacterium]|nr:hypothetical protein [Bacillota bacterium]
MHLPTEMVHPVRQYDIAGMRKHATDIYLAQMGVSRAVSSDWLAVTCTARLSELSDEQGEERHAILAYLSAHGLA